MACDATIGRLEPCASNYGGVKNLYFVNRDDDILTTATFDGSDQITAFGTLLTLYKYELRGGVHSVTETGSPSADAGTSFFTQTGSFVLKTQNLASRKELVVLAQGRPHIVIEDYQGNYRLCGIENGCTVTVESVTGAAPGDAYGYNVSFEAMEKELAFFIDSTIIDDAVNTSVTVGT